MATVDDYVPSHHSASGSDEEHEQSPEPVITNGVKPLKSGAANGGSRPVAKRGTAASSTPAAPKGRGKAAASPSPPSTVPKSNGSSPTSPQDSSASDQKGNKVSKKRAEQNRAAQKAFRERKILYIKALEEQLQHAVEESQDAERLRKENNELLAMIQQLRDENERLRQAEAAAELDPSITPSQPLPPSLAALLPSAPAIMSYATPLDDPSLHLKAEPLTTQVDVDRLRSYLSSNYADFLTTLAQDPAYQLTLDDLETASDPLFFENGGDVSPPQEEIYYANEEGLAMDPNHQLNSNMMNQHVYFDVNNFITDENAASPFDPLSLLVPTTPEPSTPASQPLLSEEASIAAAPISSTAGGGHKRTLEEALIYAPSNVPLPATVEVPLNEVVAVHPSIAAVAAAATEGSNGSNTATIAVPPFWVKNEGFVSDPDQNELCELLRATTCKDANPEKCQTKKFFKRGSEA